MLLMQEFLEWPWSAAVVTMGVFDGVHLGHQALLERTVRVARERDWRAVALTFEPHPDAVLRPEQAPKLLTTTMEKAALIERHGIEVLVVARFDQALADTEPEDFIRRVLVGKLTARYVVVGHRTRFGRRARGDVSLLREVAGPLGVEVECVGPVTVDGQVPSSTLIRERVAAGEIAQANLLLGREYTLTGTVVHGEERGRTLGFPTANLEVPPERLLPGNGVYAALARWEEHSAPAVVNVGRRPTFRGEGVTVEAYLPGFSGDLYGRRLTLAFRRRLREERRFDSPEALRKQMARDAEEATKE